MAVIAPVYCIPGQAKFGRNLNAKARHNFESGRGFKIRNLMKLLAQRSIRRRAFLHSLLGVSLARSSAAQEAVFTTDVNVVNLLVSVRDKEGRPVRDLVKDDFVVTEEGRRQTIRYFTQQSDLNLTLGLLVDTSMSQRRVLNEERQASRRFLEQMLRPEKDMAFLIKFDVETELLQDLTAQRKALESAMSALKVPEMQNPPRRGRGGGVGTVLYDAVFLAADELMRKQGGRKALILLSDGVDMGSKLSLNDSIESSQRAETLVYSIRIYDKSGPGAGGPVPAWGGRRGGRGGGSGNGRMRYPDGAKVLKRLSLETGGRYFEVSGKNDLTGIFQEIETELRNQYSIGYEPGEAAAKGEFRKIEVTTSRKGLQVQTRQGYFARSK